MMAQSSLKLRILLPLLALLSPFSAFAYPSAYLLTKGDMQICVLGTFHENLSLNILGPETQACLDAASEVLVENLGQQNLLQDMVYFSESTRDNEKLFPSELWKKIMQVLGNDQLREVFKRLPPDVALVVAHEAYIEYLIPFLPPTRSSEPWVETQESQFAKSTILDRQIQNYAKQKNTPLQGLDQNIGFGWLDPYIYNVTETQFVKAMHKLFTDENLPGGKNFTEHIRTAKRRGALHSFAMDLYTQGVPVKDVFKFSVAAAKTVLPTTIDDLLDVNFLKRILKRHKEWLPYILATAEQSKKIFVAVGKGHVDDVLNDVPSLLKLLKTEGFSIKRMDETCGTRLQTDANLK